jgi:hypothetical protein
MRLISTLLISVLLIAGVDSAARSVLGDLMASIPQNSKPSFHPLGPFRISGKQPAAFQDFCEFTLRRAATDDETSEVSIEGWVQTGKPLDISSSTEQPSGLSRCQGGIRYPFETALLKRNRSGLDQIEFKTNAINGIHYAFKGVFFEKPKRVNDTYVDLEGSLCKFENGRKVSAAQVRLINWTYE